MLTISGYEPTLLRISDKLSLRYVRLGEGPALVLLHTIRTQLEYFRDLAPLLAKKYTVYAVDLPGHGRSPIDAAAPFDDTSGLISFVVHPVRTSDGSSSISNSRPDGCLKRMNLRPKRSWTPLFSMPWRLRWSAQNLVVSLATL